MRDWSGDVDDDYEGNIQFMLLAELEPTAVFSISRSPASNTTKRFSSSVRAWARQPWSRDNAIALIGEKNTLLRTYVDTQNDPTRPTIANVSGEHRPRDRDPWRFETGRGTSTMTTKGSCTSRCWLKCDDDTGRTTFTVADRFHSR